ncbi:MAG: D-aminoacyl-tRNA deacylase [Planctomycetota bacterium]
MRVVVQRVRSAEVRVAGEVVGAIERGMVLLVCVLAGDGPRDAERLAARVAQFRFFPRGDRSMDQSALDARAEGADVRALVISQFTLAADGRKGRRPSFDQAARPEVAEPLCAHFATHLAAMGLPIATGRFGAAMEVALVNDGPVTFVLSEPGP